MADAAHSYGAMAAAPRGRESDAGLSLFLFVLIVGAITVRIVLTNPLMNTFVEYTTEEGAIYEKIHFGTYALIALCAVVPLFRPVRIRLDEVAPFRALLFFALWIAAIAGILVVMGRGGSAGYLVDSYAAAAAAGLLLFALPPAMRVLTGQWIVILLIASAVIGIGEAATEIRFLPYEMDELTFRPTGLMGHPLNQGLMLATGIGFLTAAPFRLSFKVAGVFLLLLGTVAAGARFAMISAGVSLFACLVLTQWRHVPARRQQSLKLMVLVFALLMTLPVIGLLLGAGVLDRFSGGLIDESAMARLDIYKVFNYVGWRDIVFGADIAFIQAIVERQLNLAYIESTPVILTFQLGLPGAAFFAGLLAYLLIHLGRPNGTAARIATVTFLVVALSNNHLSTKMPTVMMVVAMLVAFMSARPATGRFKLP